MNPELQAQLLEILKSLKDGASPVFDELLRQRQLHTLLSIITSLVTSFSCVVIIRILLPKTKSDDEGIYILFIFIVVILTFICVSTAVIGLIQIPDYFAPLGNVLGQVLK